MPNNVKGKNGGQGHSIKHHQNHISEKAADTIKGGESVKTGNSAIKTNRSAQDAINTVVQTTETSARASSAEGGAAASEATFASQVTRDVPDHITNRISTAENIADAVSDHQDRKVFQEKRAIATRSETSIKPTDKTLESFKPETSPFATAPDYRNIKSAADNAYQVKVHQTVIHDSIKTHTGNNAPKQPVSDLSTITHNVAQREQTIKGAAANAPAVKGMSEGPKLKTAGTQHQVLRGVGNGIKAGTAAAAHSASTVIAGASSLMGEGDESEKIANAGKIMGSQGLSDAHNDLHAVTHQVTNRIIKNKAQDHFEKKEGIKTGDDGGVKTKEGVHRPHRSTHTENPTGSVAEKGVEDVTGSRPSGWVQKSREKARKEAAGKAEKSGKGRKAVKKAENSAAAGTGGTSAVKSKEVTEKAADKKAAEKETAKKAGQDWKLRKANAEDNLLTRSGKKTAEKKKSKKPDPGKKKTKETVKKKAVNKKNVKGKPVSDRAKNAIAGPRNALATPEKLLKKEGAVKGRPSMVAVKKKTAKSKKALKTGKAARKVNKNAIKKGSNQAATKKAAELAKRKTRRAAERKVITQMAAAKKAAEAKAAASAASATAAVASGPVGWVIIAVVAVIMVVIITFIAVFGIFMNKQSGVSGGYFDGQYLDMISGTGTYYFSGGAGTGGGAIASANKHLNENKMCAMSIQAVFGQQKGSNEPNEHANVKEARFPYGSIVYVEVLDKNGQSHSRFVEVTDGCGAATGDWSEVTTGKSKGTKRFPTVKGRKTVVDMWCSGKDWPAGRYKVNVYLVQRGDGHVSKNCAELDKYLAQHPAVPTGGGGNVRNEYFTRIGYKAPNGKKGINRYLPTGSAMWAGSSLPDCTSYAWGEWAITHHNPKAPQPRGNATAWYNWARDNGYQISKKPHAGWIVCFSGPSKYGHVAFVQRVNSNGTITISESGGSYHNYPNGVKVETINPKIKFGKLNGYLNLVSR